DWSSDVCSSDLDGGISGVAADLPARWEFLSGRRGVEAAGAGGDAAAYREGPFGLLSRSDGKADCRRSAAGWRVDHCGRYGALHGEGTRAGNGDVSRVHGC